MSNIYWLNPATGNSTESDPDAPATLDRLTAPGYGWSVGMRTSLTTNYIWGNCEGSRLHYRTAADGEWRSVFYPGTVLKYKNPITNDWRPVCTSTEPVFGNDPVTGQWVRLCCNSSATSEVVNAVWDADLLNTDGRKSFRSVYGDYYSLVVDPPYYFNSTMGVVIDMTAGEVNSLWNGVLTAEGANPHCERFPDPLDSPGAPINGTGMNLQGYWNTTGTTQDMVSGTIAITVAGTSAAGTGSLSLQFYKDDGTGYWATYSGGGTRSFNIPASGVQTTTAALGALTISGYNSARASFGAHADRIRVTATDGAPSETFRVVEVVVSAVFNRTP